MEDLILEKYLNDKHKIRTLKRSSENIYSLDDLITTVNKISNLLPKLKEYKNFQGYINLTETTVDIIKNLQAKSLQDFNIATKNLCKYLDELLADLTREIKLDIYYYGKNTHNLINKKFLSANVYKLDNFYEVNYIEKDKGTNKSFSILLLEESVTFTKELNIEDKFDEIFDYSKLVKNLFDISKIVYKCDYDFNYLKNELELSSDESIKTIIVGNGYATSGIDKNLLSFKAANLSLPSQDLQHSFEIAKKTIEKNPSINKCIIGVGYYSIYHNLKKSKKKEFTRVINEIYKPIIHEDYSKKEEVISLEDYITNPIILELFNLKELSVYFNSFNHTINSNYFNNEWKREKSTVLKGEDFDSLDSDDKFSLAIWRATQHNKLINKFSKTNENVLSKLIEYLESKNVLPIIVVLPTTSYYRRFIDEKYEESFNTVIDRLNKKHKFKLIDFNSGYGFNDSDFIDVDHLNEVGSIKLTSHLNSLLKWLI